MIPLLILSLGCLCTVQVHAMQAPYRKRMYTEYGETLQAVRNNLTGIIADESTYTGWEKQIAVYESEIEEEDLRDVNALYALADEIEEARAASKERCQEAWKEYQDLLRADSYSDAFKASMQAVEDAFRTAFEAGNYAQAYSSVPVLKGDHILVSGEKSWWIEEDGSLGKGILEEDGIRYFADETSGALMNVEEAFDTLSKMPASDDTALLKEGVTEESLQRIRKAVQDIENNGFQIGFVMFDPAVRKGIVYHADQKFYTASSIKGPYVLSLLRKDPAVYTEMQEVMANTIVYSDNAAYDRLIGTYGHDAINAMMEESGVSPVVWDGGYTDLSARDLVRLWLSGYLYLNSPEAEDEVRQWFNNVAVSAIHSTLGERYTTYSKAGWIAEAGYMAADDAGIVQAQSPYILAIMTNLPADLTGLDDLVQALDEAHTEMVP